MPNHRMGKRGKGNPNWGKVGHNFVMPAAPTSFERYVSSTGIPQAQWEHSDRIRTWVHKYHRRVYVPEWLLKKFGLESLDVEV